jgi:hypothetical protein
MSAGVGGAERKGRCGAPGAALGAQWPAGRGLCRGAQRKGRWAAPVAAPAAMAGSDREEHGVTDR